jgi:hypothetical protein
VAVVAVILGLMMSATVALSNSSHVNLGVLPPNSSAYGMTYGEWNVKWWKWSFSMPVGDHPLFDSGDCDCSKGQTVPVWFLGSIITTEQGPAVEVIAKVTRNCTIPPGKKIFFPVFNVEGSTLEGNGETEEELRDYVTWAMKHIIEMSVEIDGVPAVSRAVPSLHLRAVPRK